MTDNMVEQQNIGMRLDETLLLIVISHMRGIASGLKNGESDTRKRNHLRITTFPAVLFSI